MIFEISILRRSFIQWLICCFILAVLFITSNLVNAASPSCKLTTLTFHVIAFGEGGTVLDGTLEGPVDNKSREVELVVQLYKSGQLLETRTLSAKPLDWPKANFKFPVPTGVDCYEIVALRAFDQHHHVTPSVDATAELLRPGRCKVNID